MMATTAPPEAGQRPFILRSGRYLAFLVILMGVVAIMDQYLSTIKTTALPYLMQEYGIDASSFSWLETLYMIPTFFIFFPSLATNFLEWLGRIITVLFNRSKAEPLLGIFHNLFLNLLNIIFGHVKDIFVNPIVRKELVFNHICGHRHFIRPDFYLFLFKDCRWIGKLKFKIHQTLITIALGI